MQNIRIRSLLKGVGSFAIPGLRNSHVGPDSVRSAETIYSIFLRYFSHLTRCEDFSIRDAIVLELGPGSSLGFGMAALLCGASHYHAFDHVDHTSRDADLKVFERLLELFRQKAAVPHTGKDAQVFPYLSSYEFPESCLPSDALVSALNKKRVESIRQDIADRKGRYLSYQAPWDVTTIDIREKAGLIVSNAVLEHVDDIELTYRAFSKWVKPGGYMAHVIDYGSHSLFPAWNGHWSCSESTWKLLRGRRSYLINRVPHSRHLELLAKFNFNVIADLRIHRVDGLPKEHFSSQFRDMSADDASTQLAFLICRAEQPRLSAGTAISKDRTVRMNFEPMQIGLHS
jgi:Methyltransferase domain